MAFELIIHAPDGDIVIGSYPTKTAAEKLAAITIPAWESWSVREVDEEPRPATVLSFAAYQAKRHPPPRKV
jgi:hypothetical protein